MARVDVKGLAKLEAKFKDAIRTWAELDAKASKSLASKHPNSLRVAEAGEAFDLVRTLAIQYVMVLVTGHDGKNIFTKTQDHERDRMVLRTAGELAAGLFRATIRQPYAIVFKLAELAASKR